VGFFKKIGCVFLDLFFYNTGGKCNWMQRVKVFWRAYTKTVSWFKSSEMNQNVLNWTCFFFSHSPKVLEMTEKNLSHLSQKIWKYRLKNAVTVGFNTTETNDRNVPVTKMSQQKMTEMSQWKKKRFEPLIYITIRNYWLFQWYPWTSSWITRVLFCKTC